MLSRVIAKNVGDVFFETQCIFATIRGDLPATNGRLRKYWPREKFGRRQAVFHIAPSTIAGCDGVTACTIRKLVWRI